MEIFHICTIHIVTESLMELLRTWNVANMMEELNFQFYVILTDFCVSCQMWSMATMLDSAAVDNIVL